MNMDMMSTMPVLPVTANSGGMGGMFGGNGGDWTVFLLFALIFGWGGNGFGGFGGRGATGAIAENSYITGEFNYNNLSNGIRGLERGVCDLGYNLTGAITSQGELTRGAIASGFVDAQRGFYDLSAQMANC